jgi:hypothetical protein
MYSVWIFAELTSIAAFGYAIYSVIILILGNWAGAAVFAGIIPGCVLFVASMFIYMLTKIPWRAGDYQSNPPHEYQVRQVRLFHTILWSDEDSIASPHLGIFLSTLDPIGKKNGSLVYRLHRLGFECFGRGRWLVYVWAILCEIFVLAVLFLSLWFMVWAGLEASISFLSGLFLFSSVMGARSCYYYEESLRNSGCAHAIGLTWMIIEYHGRPHLVHIVFYNWLIPLTPVFRQGRIMTSQRGEQAKNKESDEIA